MAKLTICCLISTFILPLVYAQIQPGCRQCDPSSCSEPVNCFAGKVKDRCDCCFQCGKGFKQLCDHPDVTASKLYLGKCGDLLDCDVITPPESKPEARCRCLVEGILCGDNNKTYENLCDLNEAIAMLKITIKLQHKGPCKNEKKPEDDPEDDPEEATSSSIGYIFGGIAGGVFLLGLIVVIAMIFVDRKKICGKMAKDDANVAQNVKHSTSKQNTGETSASKHSKGEKSTSKINMGETSASKQNMGETSASKQNMGETSACKFSIGEKSTSKHGINMGGRSKSQTSFTDMDMKKQVKVLQEREPEELDMKKQVKVMQERQPENLAMDSRVPDTQMHAPEKSSFTRERKHRHDVTTAARRSVTATRTSVKAPPPQNVSKDSDEVQYQLLLL